LNVTDVISVVYQSLSIQIALSNHNNTESPLANQLVVHVRTVPVVIVNVQDHTLSHVPAAVAIGSQFLSLTNFQLNTKLLTMSSGNPSALATLTVKLVTNTLS
jgi:hypothetical protein